MLIYVTEQMSFANPFAWSKGLIEEIANPHLSINELKASTIL